MPTEFSTLLAVPLGRRDDGHATFSPPAGTYSSAQTVTISDTTAGATIFFTTDGSTPTTSSTMFTTPIVVGSTTTLKAIAAAPGFANSAVATAVYTIAPPAATPTFSVPSGTYTSVQTVAISDATAGATIFFTTDGSTPPRLRPSTRARFSVKAPKRLKAIATATGFSNSAVARQAHHQSARFLGGGEFIDVDHCCGKKRDGNCSPSRRKMGSTRR